MNYICPAVVYFFGLTPNPFLTHHESYRLTKTL